MSKRQLGAALRIVWEALAPDPSLGEALHRSCAVSADTALFVLQPREMLGG
jgi:hypothetical protein